LANIPLVVFRLLFTSVYDISVVLATLQTAAVRLGWCNCWLTFV